VANNNVPTLPEEAQTPLLSTDDYIYYEAVADMGASAKEISTLFGLYSDDVYVRYNNYSRNDENYLVPNKRNATSEATIAKDAASNDSPIDISGELLYNIFWYEDSMMTYDASSATPAITATPDQDLNGGDNFVWMFESNDPYAIKIKHKKSEKYVDGTPALNSTAKTFMLLKKDDYEYGILQVTGVADTDTGKKLTGNGDALTATAETAPNKFIIFALATNAVVYNLVITNINANPNYQDIPYRSGTTAYTTPWDTSETTRINGSTRRNLESNGINEENVGQVSLGANFEIPTEMYRPNCKYYYYI